MRPETQRHVVEIFGVRIHDVTYSEALELIQRHLAERQPAMIVTPNTEIVMRARRDAAFRQTLNSAALAIPDGIGLVMASRLFGDPIREHVRGTDLVDKLAAVAAVEGYRLFMLGAAEGVAERAAAKLRERHRNLQIAGTHSGSPNQDYDATALKVLREAGRVDILLVAYGAPAQEEWIARNQRRLGVPIAIGVGGVFDFFSGEAKRAPLWLQRIELEWLYRLITQPQRWRRQLALPQFVGCALWQWITTRKRQ